MQLQIKRLSSTAIIPRYQTDGAAAIDLHADIPGHEYILINGSSRLIPTGIAIAIEPGFVGLIVPRSGLGHKKGLILGNSTGVIDSDYRGPILVSLYNRYSEIREKIKPGDRIAQMLFVPVSQAKMIEVDELPESERGGNGFGSTGQ